MYRLAILILVLGGCTDPEDDGSPDYCSGPPYQLVVQPPPLQSPENAAIAIDGTQDYGAIVEDGCGSARPPSALTVTTNDPAILTAEVHGIGIRVHAHTAGSTSVHVRSATGAEVAFEAETKLLDHVALGSTEAPVTDAFLVGTEVAAVNLWSADGGPVIDTSMTITGAPPGHQPNEVGIYGFAVGDYPLAINAANADWSATVHIVGTIDEVVARTPTVTLSYKQTAHVCFDAKLAGQVVAGAPWQLMFPHDQGATVAPNCVDVWAGGPVSYTIYADALGHGASTVVTFTH